MFEKLKIENLIKIVNCKLIIGAFILSTFYFLLSTSASRAQTMTNAYYILQMGNLNSIAGKPTGPTYKVSYTVGQTGANLFSGPNYKVRAGFQYIYSIIPFRFSISSTLVDFGIIEPGTPVTRANTLTVSNGSANGYQVTVSQNHNLRVDASGNEIPPTVCDAGSCTPTTAAAWTSSLAYGFGYRCDNVTGTDCNSQFSGSTFFRPFIASPSAVAVMSSANVGRSRKSDITYKVNISNIQAAGLYTNIINYIATPTF
ncbi:MAG: hypothetical protein AAB702_02395 [Patescibacteria group bacterium]